MSESDPLDDLPDDAPAAVLVGSEVQNQLLYNERHFRDLIDHEEQFLKLVASSVRLSSLELVDYRCCASECYCKITRWGICVLRKHLNSVMNKRKSRAEHKWAVSVFLSAVTTSTDETLTIEGRVDGQKVCTSMLAAILGLTLKDLLRTARSITNGENWLHGLEGTRHIGTKKMKEVSRAVYLFETLGQPHPVGGVVMPAGINSKELRALIGPNCTLRMSEVRKYIKKRVLLRTKDSLVRCDICCGLSEGAKLHSTWTDEEKKTALELREGHFETCRQENLMISMAEEISREEKTLLVIKCDGMGRHNTKLPHLVKRAKKISDTVRMCYDVYNVQLAIRTNEGHEFTNHLYTTLGDSMSSDADTYNSVLFDTLSKLDSIPPVLMIVLDNCNVNKSNGFYVFLSFLLARFKKLTKVFVYYAHPGHTHNSCDALFGALVNQLMTNEASCPSRLDEVLRQVGTVKSIVRHAPVYSFGNLNGAAQDYSGRLTQRFYVFYRNTNDLPSFRYQRHVRCSEWFCDPEESSDGESEFQIFLPGRLPMVDLFRPSLVPYDTNSVTAKCIALLAKLKGFVDGTAISEWRRLCSDTSLQPSDRFDAQMQSIAQGFDRSLSTYTAYSEEVLQTFLETHDLTSGRKYAKVKRKR